MNITPELLKRYDAGLCTPAEVQAVEQWLDDPDAASDAIEELPEALRHEAGERVWERLRIQSKRPLLLRYRHYLPGMAAALMLAGSIVWYSVKVKTEKTAKPVVAMQTFRTQKGQTRRLALPDGSAVLLSYDSEIRFPSAFTDSIRLVMLTGEAKFTVKKNPVQPFIVETKTTRTRVLGTVFDVRAYPDENAANLLVMQGKVQFTNKTSLESATLTAGKSGIVDQNRLLTQDVTGLDAQAAWLNNSLRFKDVTLDQITRELERRYNVRIAIRTDALKKQRYTGNFKDPSFNAILGSLSYAIGFRYEVKGESVSLYE